VNKELKTGDFAPDFTLKDQYGELVKLSDFRHKKNLVVYFYPKDETSGCTAQACAFRDQYLDFQEAGAEVIGISSDSTSSHVKFASKHKLPFILLSDEGGKVRKLYGVPNTFMLIPGRVSFVVDMNGVIRYVFNSQFNATGHIEKTLDILKSLQAEKSA